jgi:hypothetical protein
MPLLIVFIFALIGIGLIVLNRPLGKSDLVMLAENAGFQGDDANTAAAIALAESGGNPRAYNPEKQAGNPPGFGSYGLWQINLRAHPQYTASNLYDPSFNATAAFEVYTAQGWNAWSTYQSGAYTNFL